MTKTIFPEFPEEPSPLAVVTGKVSYNSPWDWKKKMFIALENLISEYKAEWKKHLAEERGSCYCMASDVSCLPERIKELEKILEVLK